MCRERHDFPGVFESLLTISELDASTKVPATGCKVLGFRVWGFRVSATSNSPANLLVFKDVNQEFLARSFKNVGFLRVQADPKLNSQPL